MTTATKAADTMSACPLSNINPMDPDILKCPMDFNRRLRAEAPVYQDPNTGIFLISKYQDVLRVVKDPASFSSKFAFQMGASNAPKEVADIQAQGWAPVDTMLTQDPPLQRRYRKMVDGAFAPRKINALEPLIRKLANDCIDKFAQSRQCDFLSEFAVPVPLGVIATQLGVSLDDLGKFKRWSDAFVGQLSQQLDKAGMLASAKQILEFQHYFAEKIEQRKLQPQDDILSDIANARSDGERPLDMAECLSLLQQILVAGNETTASSIAFGLWKLIENPDQYALLKNDASLLGNFVEEVLRHSSPSAQLFRLAAKDTEVGGVMIPEGALCFVRFASANQDEEIFADTEKFDITRDNAKSHIAFGKGIHHCLGAALARKEMNVAFEVIFSRLENFRRLDGAAEPEFAANALLHGYTAVPIAFDVIDT